MGYRDDASRLLLCIFSGSQVSRHVYRDPSARGYSKILDAHPEFNPNGRHVADCVHLGTNLPLPSPGLGPRHSPPSRTGTAGRRIADASISLSLSATLARCDLLRSQSSNAWQHRGGSASKAKARLAFERDVLLGGTCLHSGRRQSAPDDATHAVLEPGVLARARVARVQKPRRALRMR